MGTSNIRYVIPWNIPWDFTDKFKITMTTCSDIRCDLSDTVLASSKNGNRPLPTDLCDLLKEMDVSCTVIYSRIGLDPAIALDFAGKPEDLIRIKLLWDDSWGYCII